MSAMDVMGPLGPIGPLGPMEQLGPIGPPGPMGPLGPIGPPGPIEQLDPIGPFGPMEPPMGPIGPLGPMGPGMGPLHAFLGGLAPFMARELNQCWGFCRIIWPGFMGCFWKTRDRCRIIALFAFHKLTLFSLPTKVSQRKNLTMARVTSSSFLVPGCAQWKAMMVCTCPCITASAALLARCVVNTKIWLCCCMYWASEVATPAPEDGFVGGPGPRGPPGNGDPSPVGPPMPPLQSGRNGVLD